METVVERQNQHEIAPKRIMFEEIVEEGEEDRISALSDCIILEILSRLQSTKGAIRTGALSKRWKHLWTLVPSLCFNDCIHEHVDQTLNQCRQVKLNKLVVCTRYDFRFTSQVNNWIRLAISCNVEELNIKLWNMSDKAEFLLDQSFFIGSSFTDLTLTGCVLNPSGPISWQNLRSLCICFAKLNENLIENILSGSPQLETLELGDCYGYRRLDITSKSVKKLVFSGYRVHEDDDDSDFDEDNDDDLPVNFEINAPNILSLTIEDDLWLWRVLLVNVSSLVEAKLDYALVDRRYGTISKEDEEEMLKEFIIKLGHVNELQIGDLCLEVVSRLEAKGFVFSSNMKFPEVTPPSHSDEREKERCSCLIIVLKLMRLIN